MKNCVALFLTLLMAQGLGFGQAEHQYREFNGPYTHDYLDKVAFPIGGLGAGMLCMEGSGAWSHFSIRNTPDIFNEPFCFAAIHVKDHPNATKVLQGPVPKWKVFGTPETGNGNRSRSFGLPRFDEASFSARFPFAEIELNDSDIPLEIKITGWSPFTPGDEDNSSLPVGAMEYEFVNSSKERVEAVFSWNTMNIIKLNSQCEFQPFKNGIKMYQPGSEDNPEHESWFGVWVDDPSTAIDYCWYRGGWFDPLSMIWKQLESGELENQEPQGKDTPGASFFVEIALDPGERMTLPLKFAWYVPGTSLSVGTPGAKSGPAFTQKPANGAAQGQQAVEGFKGKGLVNTFFPFGDGQTGVLTSRTFQIQASQIKFRIGGGSNLQTTCVNLLIDNKVALSVAGKNEELLRTHVWEVGHLKGQKAQIQIVDRATGGWGHINVDHIVFTSAGDPPGSGMIFEDFEKGSYEHWTLSEAPEAEEACCEEGELCETEVYYKPWYAARYKSLEAIRKYWDGHYQDLRNRSALFTESFYASTLPPVVLEAVAANLTILKSPTVLRQADGRLWAWEGCSDLGGCCSGSCTHVWNYAQAICHLFPNLERSLRETEFFVSQDESGHQTFRSRLPISVVAHNYHAASDGQLGGIMKVYRDWRISGDTEWLRKIYPAVKQSLDFCMDIWDPDQVGVLTEPHHNTYDIEFWGPDGMCGSFYLGALTAFVEMSKGLGTNSDNYQEVLNRGTKFMDSRLFDGEYYIQKIQWKGLHAPDPTALSAAQKSAIHPEELERLLQEGPKYQYGTGCLSDGVLGMWMASVCGLPETMDNDKVQSHLSSIHRYNLKWDLSDHANPQRPSYALGKEAGLLLCSWPKGGALSLPFVYSNEVWTGIEYQVASHLMMKGEVEKGIDIVKACRSRYDGRVRNPFNEYECGHWYARAMSSYGLIQGLTGIRYDAVDQILYIDSKIGDNFMSFLSTETGFANVGLENGRPYIDVKWGQIPVKKMVDLSNR